MLSKFYRELAPWLDRYGFETLHSILTAPGELGPDPIQCVAVMFLDPGDRNTEPSDFSEMMRGESYGHLKLDLERIARKHGIYMLFDGPCKIQLYESFNDMHAADKTAF